MKYRGFIIDKDYSNIIRREGKNNETECGFVCRVYTEDDKYRKNCIDKFYLISDEDYDWKENDSEYTGLINYVDKNYDDLIKKAKMPTYDRVSCQLCSMANWLIAAFTKSDLDQIIGTEIAITKAEFNKIVGHDYFD